MPTFAGVNHLSLSVTDLGVSEDFYVRLFGLRRVLDVGYGRILMHQASGFVLALVHLPDQAGGRFSELVTGLDHVGPTATDRDELVEWEERMREQGVEHTPIRDMALGCHLNFRDPDGIALELQAPTEAYAAVLADVADREMSDEEVTALAVRLVGDEVPAP
ncbi:MAG: VOC family protein [Phycicoccus sp.]